MALLARPGFALAGDGAWGVDIDGNWSDATKWAGSMVADGAGNTATFNTNITALRTVTVDANHTLGGLVFGNANSWNSNNWALGGSSTLTLANGGSAPSITCWPLKSAGNSACTISAPLSAVNGFTMAGTGTLWLNGNNSGLGGTLTIASGRVFNYNANGLGTLNVSIAAGSYLSFWTGGTFAGNFTLNGLGGVIDGQTKNTLYADNSTGANVVLNGTVTLNVTSDVGGSTTNASITFKGPVTGPGGLIKQTSSSLILSGMSTFTGGITINGGMLTIGGAGQLGSGTYAANITNNGANNGAFNYNSSADQTLSGSISGSGALIQSGPGKLTLSGANTYCGLTAINGGTLALGASGSLGNTVELTISAGATLDVSALNSYALNGSTWLNASGTGTAIGSTAAAIEAAPNGTVSLACCPLDLNYDGQHPAFYISQGTLLLNGNTFILNSSAPLAPGIYTIIQQSAGSIVASGPFSVCGTAIGAGLSGSISVSGGNVNLVVQNANPTTSSPTYATWCMIWDDHNQSWWNPTNSEGATSFMGTYPSIDWANNSYVLSSLDCIRENGVSVLICDLTNGWGWLDSRVQYVQSLAAAKAMKVCVAVAYQSTGFFETNQCADVWDMFAGPSAPFTSTYLTEDGKPIIVCYCVPTQFDSLVASTGTNRQNFTLVWGAGESGSNSINAWGWQLKPSVGAIASTNSVFVTSSIKYTQTNGNPVPISPDAWRKSLAWLDYSFSVASGSHPAFVIVGSFDDVNERNGWMQCDTTLCTNGLQMLDITGAISTTNYYNRVRQWILGTPLSISGGSIPDGCYVVRNQSSEILMNIPNSIGTNYGYAGLSLVQSIPGTNSVLDNYFMFYHLGNNIYHIISLDSGLALESPNNNSGAQIVQDWDSTAMCQRWTLIATNDSYYLQNLASGKVLDVAGAITAGTAVVQNPMTNGLASQQWTLGLVARIGSPPPVLTARQAGEDVQLSWPLGYAGYILQKQSRIAGLSSSPGAWLDVGGVVSNSYSESLTNRNCFYRLKSQ